MAYFKISLYSNQLLSLPEKKKYINLMYDCGATYNENKKKRLGYIHKFNNAIGFKPVIDELDNFNYVIPAKISSPENYISPESLLYNEMTTPVASFDILNFYIRKMKINHPNIEYSYHTRTITYKWINFLKKIFPQLEVSVEEVTEKPKQSLRDFALEYFYRNIEKNINYTIEFASRELLSKDDIDYILPKIQILANDKIAINQYKCDTCAEYSNGEKPYHIEIDYITWYGKEKTEDEFRIYI